MDSLGSEELAVEHLVDSVTGHAQLVQAEVWPSCVEDVVALVRSAMASGRPIYPVSTGRNWGYGSCSPPSAGCTLVRLEKMNRIRNANAISVDNPVALIEPGVTQGQLHEFLQKNCPALMFSITGSSKDSSILGNALDGGIGYLGPRRADIFGLEVVLGSGDVVKTGFRRLGDEAPLANGHAFGMGPSMDGLFVQGNFGVVTSGYLQLVPRPAHQVALSLALTQPDKLADLLRTLLRLKREGTLPSVTHLGNRERTVSTLKFGVADYLMRHGAHSTDVARLRAVEITNRFARREWVGLATVSGTPRQTRASIAEIAHQLAGIARVTAFGTRSLHFAHGLAHRLRAIGPIRDLAALSAAALPLHGLAMGTPTDYPVHSVAWGNGLDPSIGTDLDHTHCGLLYICPALPNDAALAVAALTDLRAVAASFGHALAITVNVETSSSLVAVMNLNFDRRDPEQIVRAHRCADALLADIHRAGLEVYRARADMMSAITERTPEYWATIQRLKQALDPKAIIAPGRYCPIC